MIFLDLDGFKSVNDAHGHLAGSRTLTEVGGHPGGGGARSRTSWPATAATSSWSCCRRRRLPAPSSSPSASARAIECHVFLKDVGLEARISASFGIASYPDHALTPEGLIQKADQAMYRVKDRDKNGIEVAV